MKRDILICIGSILIGVFFTFLLAGWAGATTYYLRADGTVTAANKANATSCGAVGSAMNIAQHNVATFAAGDTITLCDTGGAYRDTLTPPTSGTSGSSRITYNASGSPIINGSDVFTGWTTEAGNTNLAPNPEAFDAWTPFQATVSANAAGVTDPNGGTASDSIIPDNVDHDHIVFETITGVAASTTYTISVWAKPGLNPGLMLFVRYYNAIDAEIGTASYMNVNVATQATNYTNGSSVFYTNGTNGLSRTGFTITTPALTTHVQLWIYLMDGIGNTYAGDNTSVGMYLFGAVMEAASSASQYGTAYYHASTPTPVTVYEGTTNQYRTVSTKKEIFAGSLWYDSGNSRVYVKTTNNTAPSNFTMEVPQRNHCVLVSGKNYITVDGLEMDRSNLNNYRAISSTAPILTNSTFVQGNYATLFWNTDGFDMTGCTASKIKDNPTFYFGADTTMSGTINTSTAHDAYMTPDRTSARTGFYVSGTAVITGTTLTAYGVEDGMGSFDSATFNCHSCDAHANGLITYVQSGEGFCSHGTSVLNLYNCTAYDNLFTGLVAVESSTGIASNCAFTNNSNGSFTGPLGTGISAGIYLTTSGAWTVSGGTITGHTYGISINPGAYITVTGAEITGFTNLGILTTGAANHITVTKTYIHDGQGTGIGVSGGTTASTFAYNKIWNLAVSAGVGTYYNGIDVNSNSTGNFFYNNSIAKVYQGSLTFETGSTGNTAKNNILDSTGNGAAFPLSVYVDSSITSLTLGNNDYWFTTYLGNWKGSVKTVFADWTTATSETGSISADPKFVSTATPDFHLQAGSPAIDAGIDWGQTRDYSGMGRIGSAWDIGAYEYGGLRTYFPARVQ